METWKLTRVCGYTLHKEKVNSLWLYSCGCREYLLNFDVRFGQRRTWRQHVEAIKTTFLRMKISSYRSSCCETLWKIRSKILIYIAMLRSVLTYRRVLPGRIRPTTTVKRSPPSRVNCSQPSLLAHINAYLTGMYFWEDGCPDLASGSGFRLHDCVPDHSRPSPRLAIRWVRKYKIHN